VVLSVFVYATASPPPNAPDFTEHDALGILQRVGDALENGNERSFLSNFDADRMPDYPVFRDQVHTFFQQYESFRVSYQVQQVAMEGANGVSLSDFTLDARPRGGELPDVRKQVQLRLVLAWNGKAWKIADLSPRELFGS
jgi:hypothetical protein